LELGSYYDLFTPVRTWYLKGVKYKQVRHNMRPSNNLLSIFIPKQQNPSQQLLQIL